jgi:predicted transcriptional regulator
MQLARWAFIDGDESLQTASRVMHDCGVDKVVVTAPCDGAAIPVGMLSAQDIVTHVVAFGLDTSVLTAGDLLTLRR